MPLWERESCDAALRTQFGPNYRIPDTALCAGAEGRDACDVSTITTRHKFLSVLGACF